MFFRSFLRPKKKKPWTIFFTQGFLIILIMLYVWHEFKEHYTIAINSQKCLPYKMFLIDKDNKKIPQDGFVAFKTDNRMLPFFPVGSMFVKKMIGTSGDKVIITPDCKATIINQKGETLWWDYLNDHVLKKIHKSCSDLATTKIIPEGQYFVVGTSPRSFDSRYWGFLKQKQIVGRAFALF
jgi:conjugal transfer pilin signal peptidase TrbI